MQRILFVGDVVGEPGLAFLEAELPRLRARHRPDFVIVNGENMAITGVNPVAGCGLSAEGVARLLALEVDVVTGGNHSWDGPQHGEALDFEQVLRPLNAGHAAPGRGATVVEKSGVRLGVVNLASRTALPFVDHPYDVLEQQLARWRGEVDAVLVDFHGESVSEKQMFGFAVDGRVAAVIGTHTHVPTLDARLLPAGTAFVTDVGMTGPSGGMQGYDPDYFVPIMRTRLPNRAAASFASGPVQLGAVLVTFSGSRASAIERLAPPDSAAGGSGVNAADNYDQAEALISRGGSR